MAYNTGVNDKVNGQYGAGEFLTGNMNFYQMATLVPMFQTNVDTPVAFLYTQQGYSTWQPVTVIDGTGAAITYSTQSDYQDAFNKQANLNLLVQLFATRANPVAISISQQTISNPHTTTAFPNFLNQAVFGSAYTSSTTVTTVKLATEKSLLWNVTTPDVNSNSDGYELLDIYQGVAVADLDTPVLVAPIFDVSNSANLNLIAYRSDTL